MFEVEKLMTINNTKYHTFRHISDVTQTVATICHHGASVLGFDDANYFTMIVGALCHDLDHTGTNNLYHINAQTDLAIRYNDISILENHHCAQAFTLFKDPRIQMLSGMAPDLKRRVRKDMIAIILATDMSVHFALKAELDDCITRNKDFLLRDVNGHSSNGEGAASTSAAGAVSTGLNEKDKIVMMKSILHTADISNPAKKWEISKAWSDVVILEFFEQGDREKAEGLPVSMNTDRLTTHQDELSINFGDFIVAPQFISMAAGMPMFRPVLSNLIKNRDIWTGHLETRVKDMEDGLSTIEKFASRRAPMTSKLEDAAAGR
jgi:hypothetical protein